MKQESLVTPSQEDAYPSRAGRRPGFLERTDPVVYAARDVQTPISSALVRQYDEQGFLILDSLFSENEIKEMQQELVRLQHQEGLNKSETVISEPGSGEVRSIFQVHQSSPLFQRLAADPRLADIARYLLGDEVYIHQSRLNYKPGFRGKEFYWHSDFETWHVEDGMPRMRALSMSITLTENHEFNGPLMVIPGSHRRFVVCEGFTPENHYQSSLKKQEYGIPSDALLQQLVDDSHIVTATGKAGSVILFDCNLMHGSNGNITPFPRSNAFFVYNAMSNKVTEPFAGTEPRPEYICARRSIDMV